MQQKRRDFLKFMGYSSLGISTIGSLGALTGCESISKLSAKPPFSVLPPTHADTLSLATGFNYNVLLQADTPINNGQLFGHNNDFTAFLPFTGKTDAGLLWVNHEYLHRHILHQREASAPVTQSDILKEKRAVGGSIVEVKKVNNKWAFVKNSKYNRRIDGLTPIPFEKGYKISGRTHAIGTLANCAGGVTPWGTVLTCEENYDLFYGENVFYKGKTQFKERKNDLNWHKKRGQGNPPEHYGWVVEVNLKTGEAVKRNALGRFSHEGATVTRAPSGKTIVYMGEDKVDGFIYKFVSDTENSLSKGTLYAADTEKGRWLPLEFEKDKRLQKEFKNQTQVLTYASRAAQIVGATPQDRPEDIEIHPTSKGIFVALTKNPKTKNYKGSILKITETNNDFESLTFKAATWISGGIENGFACPDNMVFDNKGNMWMTVDMSNSAIKKGHYKGLGNNGLYYIPMNGAFAGQALLVASAPIDAELTGPSFSPDYKTLFLSVQHPGSSTTDPKNPTSTWPNGGFPRSSVVTIQGPALEALLSS